MKIRITKVPRDPNIEAYGGALETKDKDNRDNLFLGKQNRYDIGGILQSAGVNWNQATEIGAGGQHEENPYEGVLVGVDPEGTPNLVEEGEVIWNDYVFSNRLKCPKEVCKILRIGVKKDGFTFAEAAKRLLKESKERPNDPISKNGLAANMQKLEDAQEELKKKMEAEEAVEQFNSLPPEQQVAIMNQEGERALNAVAQEQMAQEFQNLPPEQQQAIAQQMAMEQALAQGVPPQGPSPEEQAIMQLQAMQQPQGINSEQALAQAAAMQQQALNGMACGGKLLRTGGPRDRQYVSGARSHWETDENGHRVLVPNFEFGGGQFGHAGGGGEWGEDPTPLMPKERDWLAIDYQQSFNDAYREARRKKKKTFWFNGKEYNTDYNPNLTEEQVKQGKNRYQTKGLIIAPWEHSFGGKLFAEGGELNEQQPTDQAASQSDTEMARYSDEELQDMIQDYQEAESGEVKVTKGKLARLRKKAEKAERELERRHSEENQDESQEARQEPSQEEIQAAAQALAQQQMMEGLPQEGVPLEGMSPELAMMMQQQMGGQQMSPEEMAAMELRQLGNGQYAYGGRLYPTGGPLGKYTPYFTNMEINDLLGLVWDNMSAQERNGITRDQFINDNRGLYGDAAWDPYKNQLLQVYYSTHPEAQNSGWTFNSKHNSRVYNPLNLGNIQAAASTTGYKKINESDFLDDYVYKMLDENQRQLLGNYLAEALEGKQEYKDFTNYLRQHKGDDYVKNYFGMLADHGSLIAKKIVKKNSNGEYEYIDNLSDDDYNKYITSLREDGTPAAKNNKNGNALSVGHFTPQLIGDTSDRYWIKKDDGTFTMMTGKPTDDQYTAINPNNPYQVSVGNDNEGYHNYNDYYYSAKPESATTAGEDNDESKYLTVGWKPRTNWMDYAFGALPGLTGLAMMLGQGKPDTSGIEAAADFYANSGAGVMAPPHLTHGLIRPAIVDPRVTHNTLTAARLGTNRMLRNTGSAPSQAATILANDANYQNQMGQNDLRDWLANREQEQKAAQFNRETATQNATFLNQTDQFNAQMLANRAERAAQLRYNAEKEKLDQENAWRAGLLGNVGSAMTGVYNAWREGQNRNERDLLMASEVFGPTNGLLDYYYGIRKVNPNTGQIMRGPDTGKYWYNNDVHDQPPLATSVAAKGGKLKRKTKKRKGFTF